MAYTLLRIIFIFLSIAINLQHTFCDERLQIHFKNGEQPRVKYSHFNYDQIISGDQMELFQLDGDKAIDAWSQFTIKENSSSKHFRQDRPKCVVLNGPCRSSGKNHFGTGESAMNWTETKFHVVVVDKNASIDYSRGAKNVRRLSEIFVNNSTRKAKWTLRKKFTIRTRITRIHRWEPTNAWALDAGMHFLQVVTESGSFEIQSKWSQDLWEMKYFQVELPSVFEIDVDPGESVRSYVAYKERPFTLQMTYGMSIDYENGGYTVAEYDDGTASAARTYDILAASGKLNTYDHTIRLEFVVPFEVGWFIERVRTNQTR